MSGLMLVGTCIKGRYGDGDNAAIDQSEIVMYNTIADEALSDGDGLWMSRV